MQVETKEVVINCMVPAEYPGHYRWPEFGRDKIWYRPSRVKRKLQPPTPATNHRDIFKFEYKKEMFDWIGFATCLI